MSAAQTYCRHIFKASAIVFSIALFVVVFHTPVLAASGINRQINFQGKLVDNTGLNVSDGSRTVIFSIYNTSSGGAALWTETQTVTTTDGIFRVALGSSTAFPANFNFNWDGLYLGIKVGADSEMTPRIQLAAVPYAFNAEKVSGLTVQDDSGNASTSGILQVANGKTITFGNSFSSGSNALTITTSGTTSLAFAGSGALTLVDTSSAQTLTNKTFTDSSNGFADNGDATKILKFDAANIGSGTTLTLAIPSSPGTSDTLCLQTKANCASAGGVNYWQLGTGSIAPGNLTTDFLVGSAATVSAKFGVLNINSGVPVATIAGTFSLGTGDTTIRTIGTTRMNPLQLGDVFTGDLIFAPANTTAMTIKSSGNVGIGITTPTQKLDIVGNLQVKDAATATKEYRFRTNGSNLDFDAAGTWMYFSTFQNADYTGTQRTFIVLKNDADFVSAYKNWEFKTAGDAQQHLINSDGGASFNITGGAFDFGVSSDTIANLFFVKGSTDRVGIATTLPTSLLDVAGTASVSGSLSFRNAAASVVATQLNDLTLGDTATGKVIINPSGNIGIGTTVPGFKLDVTGAARFTGAITVASCSGCGAGPSGGGSNWTLDNGVLRPNNNTLDILLGGTSTSSAKFSFLNMNPSSGADPVASFAGHLMLDAMPDSSVTTQTTWTQVSGTMGTIGNGATTGIASVSASAIYNGSLYVGTYKDQAGGAEVYRYNGTGTSWTKVSQSTAGTLSAAGGSTTNIGSISAMTVFDGYLYVGTSKMNSAEVYRYDGGTTWTKVSGTTGTIGGGATTSIDGVSALGVYQGRLIAGTREFTKAEVYRYDGGSTWEKISNGTAGTFVATNTVSVNAVTSFAVLNGVLYAGLAKTGDADVIKYTGAQTWISVNAAGTTGSYTINSAAVTAFDESYVFTYSGALVVGLRKLNAAEIVEPIDTGTAVTNMFARLNNASGQMTSGGTSNIDAVTTFGIYGGFLFIGTSEPGGAEIYRYTGTDQKFFKVSQAAAGTIANGGTSGIDQVTVLQPTNGDFYTGTFEAGRAEVYKYTANVERSYALKFHAAPTIDGGEQSSVLNEASIYFVASASANLGSATGNTGAIVFSHGIQTRNGSYDVAEDYPTRDDTIEAGDVVAIDENERGFVKKATDPKLDAVIGVYSENPALRLTQEDAQIAGGRAIPISLAGRVPVKVSTESGVIKSGDYLTLSSVAGVAMKATKAGEILGRAMQSYDGDGIGKITAFVTIGSFNGESLDQLDLPQDSNDVAKAFLSLDNTSSQNTAALSDIVSDRVAAGLEVIAPLVSTKTVRLDTLQPLSSHDIAVDLGIDGTFIIRGLDGNSMMTIDALGNATISGTLTAKSIYADHIEGLDELVSKELTNLLGSGATLSASLGVLGDATVSAEPIFTNQTTPTLSSFVGDGLATVSGDFRVKGNSLFEGVVSVVDTMTTPHLIVSSLAHFFGDVVFKGAVRFDTRPTVNSDTAGYATIKQGTDSVQITYDKNYDDEPVINVSFTSDDASAKNSSDAKTIGTTLLDKGYTYVVTERSKKGFTILLNKKADTDILFSWTAVSVSQKGVDTNE